MHAIQCVKKATVMTGPRLLASFILLSILISPAKVPNIPKAGADLPIAAKILVPISYSLITCDICGVRIFRI